MKIGSSTTTRPTGGVSRASAAAGTSKAEASGAAAARQPADVASVMGIPETELTPKVRAAIGQLMSEVQRLRQDLEQAKKRINFLEDLSDQDPLLPIINRRAFVRELTRFISFAERYQVPGSVLYFDVNGMKQINDSLGHAAGDAALKHVAEVLVQNVRASDVVGRLGGDEFGVLLAQADQATAETKATELAEAIAGTPLYHEGHKISVQISWGSFTFEGNERVDDALDAADRAMYARKQTRLQGRDEP